jgi:hypothetical protein
VILRPTRQVGLQALAALLGLLTGVAIWLGATVPDPNSCVAVAMESFKGPASPGLDARLRKACRRMHELD